MKHIELTLANIPTDRGRRVFVHPKQIEVLYERNGDMGYGCPCRATLRTFSGCTLDLTQTVDEIMQMSDTANASPAW